MTQISIFDFLDETEYLSDEERIFRSIIDHGSVTQDSIKRIKNNIKLPPTEFTRFLIKEFGIGGFGWKGCHAFWDAKGLKCGAEWSKMKLYSWDAVAKAFKDKYEGVK